MDQIRFAEPAIENRLMQFIPAFELWCGPTAEGISANLQALHDVGVGGIVVTVDLVDYLHNDSAWETLRRGVEIAKDFGLRVWIYDEKGYPSGGAGGLVLKSYPQGEAQGLVRHVDANGTPQYEVVRLYEGTHATENFYEKRPYINILDPGAVQGFVQVTHEQYARALQPISECVEAFFTDEPSLISAYIPQGKSFPPTLPWHPSLPRVFEARKGYELTPQLRSLFEEVGPGDRRVRCDFYEVVADLCAETYFANLQQWCHRNGVKSSGHLLGEETLVWQTLFEGDPFPCYRKFDIPGIDMILSDPHKIMTDHFFLVPKLCSSAARLQGERRVMCEISDYLGAVEKRHASPAQMQCTAAILFALGVTDMVSMYTPPVSPQPDAREQWPGEAPYSAAAYRAYNDFTARLNTVCQKGHIKTDVAVLHPLRSVWAHYTPSHRSMYEPHPNTLVTFIDKSFTGLCRNLLQHQFDFDIVDERSIARAHTEGGILSIGDRRYHALVLPPLDTVGLQTMEVVAQFVDRGGFVVAHELHPLYATEGPDRDDRVQALMAAMLSHHPENVSLVDPENLENVLRRRLQSNCLLSSPSQNIICTWFSSESEEMFLCVNTGATPYEGEAIFPAFGSTGLYDCATGMRHPLESKSMEEHGSRVILSFGPLETLLVSFAKER